MLQSSHRTSLSSSPPPPQPSSSGNVSRLSVQPQFALANGQPASDNIKNIDSPQSDRRDINSFIKTKNYMIRVCWCVGVYVCVSCVFIHIFISLNTISIRCL